MIDSIRRMQLNGLWLDYLQNAYNEHRRPASSYSEDERPIRPASQFQMSASPSKHSKLDVIYEAPCRSMKPVQSQPRSASKNASFHSQSFVSINNHTIKPQFESEQYKKQAKEILKRRMSYQPKVPSTRKTRNSEMGSSVSQ